MMSDVLLKIVEQLRNTGIINSTTRSHLVGYFYKIYDRSYISTPANISQGMHRDNFIYIVAYALHCSNDVSGTDVKAFHFF